MSECESVWVASSCTCVMKPTRWMWMEEEQLFSMSDLFLLPGWCKQGLSACRGECEPGEKSGVCLYARGWVCVYVCYCPPPVCVKGETAGKADVPSTQLSSNHTDPTNPAINNWLDGRMRELFSDVRPSFSLWALHFFIQSLLGVSCGGEKFNNTSDNNRWNQITKWENDEVLEAQVQPENQVFFPQMKTKEKQV